jgi:hypothetical protein
VAVATDHAPALVETTVAMIATDTDTTMTATAEAADMAHVRAAAAGEDASLRSGSKPPKPPSSLVPLKPSAAAKKPVHGLVLRANVSQLPLSVLPVSTVSSTETLASTRRDMSPSLPWVVSLLLA